MCKVTAKCVVLSDMCKVTAKCVVCCAPDPLSDMCKVTAKCVVLSDMCKVTAKCAPDPLSDMCKVTAKCVVLSDMVKSQLNVCCAPDPLSDMCKVTAKCVVRCAPDPLDQEVSCITEAEEDLQSSSSFCRADDATSACAAKELKTADSVIQFMKKVWWFCGGFECRWSGGGGVIVILDTCTSFLCSFSCSQKKLDICLLKHFVWSTTGVSLCKNDL